MNDIQQEVLPMAMSDVEISRRRSITFAASTRAWSNHAWGARPVEFRNAARGVKINEAFKTDCQ